ncbi:hypothetical protein J4Q44_G00304750 [Coregonus suidteri]|uniref:Uncharacterized protein n=1 Tax=Coregonus suidteri TaxID=861788 RepID=A0AAN8L0Q5_9TELE
MMGLDFACGGRQDAGRGVAVAAPSAMDTVTEMTGAGDRSGSAKSSSEVGPQQQHAEGELRDILDHFLRSFEQQVAASNPVAEGQGEGARSTASLSEPYTALRNYSGAQMVTSTAEHRTPSTQVREEQSYTHTAHTHTSNTGQSNTHLAQVEQCSTVTHPAHTHLPLNHTSPLLHSTPTNSVQPTSALPPTSLPPSPGEEGRVMTRRQLRGEINIQPIVNQVADALPGVCAQTNKIPCQPAVCVVRMEKTVLPGAESLTGKCPPPVNRPIRSAEKIKSQTNARSAAESDTTQKSPPLPNPPISPFRTPEKLRGYICSSST